MPSRTTTIAVHRPAARAHVIATWALCCLVLPSCAATTDRGEDDIDGIAAMSLSEDRRIGSVDDPDVGFSRLVGVDVDSDGLVYALEALDNQIRVYDANGSVVRRIGRSGSGPGEFESPPRFGVSGDTVWAYDMDAGRITLFDRQGTLLSTGSTHGFRIPLANSYGHVMPSRMRADGRFTGWLNRISFSRNDPPTGVAEDSVVRVPQLLFDATGAVVDTIGWLPSPPPRMVRPPDIAPDDPEFITVGSRRYMVPQPPTERPDWVPFEDGHVVIDQRYPTAADAGTFTVTRIDLAGDTVYHRVLKYRPEPFTSADLDTAAVRGVNMILMVGQAPEAPDPAVVNALRGRLDFPEYKLPVQNSWGAQDGGLWLRRAQPTAASAQWIVIAPDGSTRGQVELPSRARLLWNRGDTVWASVPDDMDVPWLVRYTLTG